METLTSCSFKTSRDIYRMVYCPLQCNGHTSPHSSQKHTPRPRVYIEKNSRNTIAQQLFDVLILTRSPDWPIDELNIMRLNPDFKCCQIAEEAQLARITRQSSNQPLPPTRRYTRDTQPSVPANSSVTTTQQKEQEKKVENTVDVRPSRQQEQQACIATSKLPVNKKQAGILPQRERPNRQKKKYPD
ncbi:hypothetical protein P3342_007474 [Pyrenophora teres f. teres]|nr:hypothetical protein P3342_007474 [Pyrenophora teres f. teres]